MVSQENYPAVTDSLFFLRLVNRHWRFLFHWKVSVPHLLAVYDCEEKRNGGRNVFNMFRGFVKLNITFRSL